MDRGTETMTEREKIEAVVIAAFDVAHSMFERAVLAWDFFGDDERKKIIDAVLAESKRVGLVGNSLGVEILESLQELREDIRSGVDINAKYRIVKFTTDDPPPNRHHTDGAVAGPWVFATGMRQAQHGPTNWNVHLDRVVGRVCSDNDFICF
jgi:hypothetical protein